MMRFAHRHRGIVAFVVVFASRGSGGDGDGDGEEVSQSTLPASSTSTTSTTITAVDEPDEQPETDRVAAEDPPADIFPEIIIDPTEAGPRPVLSWSKVERAALYQLTVLDAGGVPYWAWSGTENAVPLGGMDNPDAIGAWVFEELTWTVVARDTGGTPLGMSHPAVLRP